jgi:hypothetical protein
MGAAHACASSFEQNNEIWFRAAGRASQTNPADFSGKLSLMERNQDTP